MGEKPVLNELFFIDQLDILRWRKQWGRMKPWDRAGKVYPTSPGQGFPKGSNLVRLDGNFYEVAIIKTIVAQLEKTHPTHAPPGCPFPLYGQSALGKTHAAHAPSGLDSEDSLPRVGTEGSIIEDYKKACILLEELLVAYEILKRRFATIAKGEDRDNSDGIIDTPRFYRG